MAATLTAFDEDFDIRSCYIAPYTRSTNVYGTAVQPLFNGGQITETLRTADRNGDGALFATYSKLDFIEISLDLSAHISSVYKVLTGGSHRKSGSGDDEVRTFGTPTDNIFPYFGLKMIADLVDGGRVVFFAPVCTVTGNIQYNVADGEIMMPSVPIRAYRNNNFQDNNGNSVPLFKITHAKASTLTENLFPAQYINTSNSAWTDVTP